MNLPGPDRRIVFIAANASVDRLLEVESLTPGAIHRPICTLAVPGGKGLNAARAAFALQGRVTAIAILAGHAGGWIAEQLAEEGIEVLTVLEDGESRTCVSILDRSTGRLTEFYEAGQPLRDGTWERFEGVLVRQLEDPDVGAIVMSGSLPPGAPSDGYARLVHLARSTQVMTFLDASGPAMLSALRERPAYVKVNAVEAATTAGTPVTDGRDAGVAASWFNERGAEHVVITLGERGAVGLEAGVLRQFAPPPAHGAYPVGSGDAFMAGLAVAAIGGSGLYDAMVLGIAAGVANALVPGAGRLDPASVERLRAAVRLEAEWRLP